MEDAAGQRHATRPLVSVITPMRNAAATVAATVASIQTQTMPDWEALLIDDASQDASAEIAASLAAADARIRLLRLPRAGGAAVARNAGIAAARGRYIAFLDSDDLWYPQKLSRQVAALEAGAGFVFAAYRRCTPGGHPIATVPAPPRVDYDMALNGNPIGCLTAIYDTEVYGKVEMPLLTRRQDYALWLNLLKRGRPATGLPDVLADCLVRPGSLSSNKLRAAAATWVVLRHEQALPLGRAVGCFLRYAWRALGQRMAERLSR